MQCKYVVKGERGCESRRVDNEVLYQAFVGAFNAMVDKKDLFIWKWRERLMSDNALLRHKAKQFIGIMADTEVINEFDEKLYFALVEKMAVHGGVRLAVGLLGGTEIECG